MLCLSVTHILRRAGYGYLFSVVILIMISCPYRLSAQKLPVDTAIVKHWSKVSEGAVISPDGRFVVYGEFRNGEFLNGAMIEVTVKSVSGNWSLKLGKGDWNYKEFWYDSDHQWLLLNGHITQVGSSDTLKIIDLASKKIIDLPGIVSYRLVRGNLFLIRKKEDRNELLLRTGLNDLRLLASDLSDNSLQQYGRNLLLNINQRGKQHFKFLDVETKRITDLFSVEYDTQITINEAGTKFAFIKQASIGPQAWIFDALKKEEKQVLASFPLSSEPEMILDGITGFSRNDLYLLFTVRSKAKNVAKIQQIYGPSKIWYYDSDNLSGEHVVSSVYAAVLSLKDKKVNRLQYEGDSSPGIAGDWALVEHRLGDGDNKERNWNIASQKKWRLVSLINGKTKNFNDRESGPPSFSPNGKFLIWFDKKKKDYSFLNLVDNEVKDLLKAVKGSRLAFYNDYIEGKSIPGWDLQWFNHDSLLLIRDQHNLWKIDIAGDQKPVRLTGKDSHDHIVFDFLDKKNFLRKGDTLYLMAFDRQTKDNGLYELIYEEKPRLKKLFMWPYATSLNSTRINGIPHLTMSAPVKAESADIWLILKQNASESPNYFTTSDFKTFKPVTNIYPESSCNWMSSKLYQWKGLNGETLQGILYKPENFDPKKKYPVIFYYYEKASDGLNGFIAPELCSGPLEIPWFVSRGYLIFAPDIRYRMGYAGQSALSSIESAAEMLAKLPFVNAGKMGLQGHSFGGFETNYIVTHSTRFAAACSASGINNLFTDYGELGRQEQYELRQYRIGYSPFDRPDLYIENSPILKLKQVTTPLLIMHTTEDKACQFKQAIALFGGLRRLRKPGWLLAYPNANHVLSDPDAIWDYTQKLQQFFDHYLKDQPKPEWMMSGRNN